MKSNISNEEKKYILQYAEKCKKNGFVEEAAQIYDKLMPNKSKKIYLYIAKRAEKRGLLILAARMYGCAGKENKSISLYKKLENFFEKKGFKILSQESAESSKKEEYVHTKMRELNMKAWGLLKLGRFQETKKAFFIAARFAEHNKWYEYAMSSYFYAGDFKNANRIKKILEI